MANIVSVGTSQPTASTMTIVRSEVNTFGRDTVAKTSTDALILEAFGFAKMHPKILMYLCLLRFLLRT